MPEFVDVAVPVAVRKTFAYSVPAQFRTRISVGVRVLVPFGRKMLTGVVVGCGVEPPQGIHVRPLRELLDPQPAVPASLVKTALWTASRYFTPPGEVLRVLFPSGAQVTGKQKIRLTARAMTLLSGGLRPVGVSSQEMAILDILRGQGAMSLKDLQSAARVSNAGRWAESLLDGNWIEVEDHLARSRVSDKEQLAIRVLATDDRSLKDLTAAQRRLYELLTPGSGPIPLADLLRRGGVSAAVANALVAKGIVSIAPMKIARVPMDLMDTPLRKVLNLTKSQEQVFELLRHSILTRRPERCLLHGVTGSGKTEIYLRLIAEVLKSGGTAILLVPEIGLTPLLSRIAVSHFPDKVALLHSGMSQGERYDQWNRIRIGLAPVVVGTRSAVFAPLDNLSLIVVDEEQDGSYKQDETPCYHAREVAWHRLQQSGGLLLMGSATPSIETYHAATVAAEIRYLALPERVEAKPLPEVTVVDMSREFQRHGRTTILSQTLLEQLRTRLARGEQSMVLLNRRGYARSLLCRSCGHSFSCPDCSISMTYHQERNILLCHYCGMEASVPSSCSSCGAEYIYFVGVGTEQLEEILHKLLPKARLARLDRDTTRRRGTLRKTLLDFSAGRLDILVGTQILAKGHDFPNVTLVGVVAADAGLQFPDFRSAERTFQLLTQVAGRAGRGETPGQVVIQSFYPDHYALRFARRQDYAAFYSHEVEFRRQLHYPPFTRLVQILVADPDANRAFQTGEKIASALKSFTAGSDSHGRIQVLGPASAPLEKLRGEFRVQVLMKVPYGDDPTALLREGFQYLGGHRVPLRRVHVDVDPLSLL